MKKINMIEAILLIAMTILLLGMVNKPNFIIYLSLYIISLILSISIYHKSKTE